MDAAYIRLDLELIASSTEATKLDSTNAVYFNQLGDAYLRSGQYEEAIAPYFKSVYYSKGLDNMSKFTNLIPINFTVLEKQKIITKLIIPLNKVFIQNGSKMRTHGFAKMVPKCNQNFSRNEIRTKM